MKALIYAKKAVTSLPAPFVGIDTPILHYDSFEIMAVFYADQIKKTEEALNRLSITDDAKLVIKLCSKVIDMKKKLRRGW
jgi:hypothetical protein